MSAPLASLTEIFGSNVVSGDIFYVTDSTSTNTYKISRDELSKAFTGFTAQNVNGFSIFESAGEYGLSVSGSNGFIGVNNRTPFVSLDIKLVSILSSFLSLSLRYLLKTIRICDKETVSSLSVTTKYWSIKFL